MNARHFISWVHEFEADAERRRADGDPDFTRGAHLDRAVVRSLQRFQLGETGDGANLIDKADRAGNADYAAAVRLFVAEERNHARLLALLLAAANSSTISGHWSDTVFVRLRRALGLRLELMVLFVAEVIALRYYRACRDSAGDPVATEVASRILADEERHVLFHSQRLDAAFAEMTPPVRHLVTWAWRLLLHSTVIAVAYDHGAALRRLGLTRRQFATDVAGRFNAAITEILRGDASHFTPAAPGRVTAQPEEAAATGPLPSELGIEQDRAHSFRSAICATGAPGSHRNRVEPIARLAERAESDELCGCPRDQCHCDPLLFGDPAARRARDRIALSDGRWSTPSAQISAVRRGCLGAAGSPVMGADLASMGARPGGAGRAREAGQPDRQGWRGSVRPRQKLVMPGPGGGVMVQRRGWIQVIQKDQQGRQS